MSSQLNHLFLPLSTKSSAIPSSSLSNDAILFAANSFGANNKLSLDFCLKCGAMSNPRIQEYEDSEPVIKWHQILEADTKDQASEVLLMEEKNKEILVHSIKKMLNSMDDGEISISAYDTAWVALIEDVHGNHSPQFPSTLQWISTNQLPDGSWGENEIFSAHDRIINTLACVVALKSWNLHPQKCKNGMKFLKENISKLEDEKVEHMTIGFEVTFPSLLQIARSLNLQLLHDDSPLLQSIYAKRNVKLSRIPKEIMHKVPTTLLFSLEGMAGLKWEKLLKLQSQDGSFVFSPSSTAFAFMHTKNENCFRYLEKTINKFNGGVPNVYPVDIFERIWAIDRLQRLGISRYFQIEIKECLNYVYKYWTQKGIGCARNSKVYDVDDTAMGFRLLRLYGHDVSADVFRDFIEGGKFICMIGQSTQAVTGMFNLYRASQVRYAGEKILEDANQFSSKFLREKQVANELIDKWIIAKDLPGEVGYALEVPWYASLPRIEARFYLEQYGGEDDVWIGKTLYRMPKVNNNAFLELANLDYNNCQSLHQTEWFNFQKWYNQSKVGDYGMSKRSLLLAYFCAAANIFEPERVKERVAWAKTNALVETIASHFEEASREQRRAFVHEFNNIISEVDCMNSWTLNKPKLGKGLVGMLLQILTQISVDSQGRDRDHSHYLYCAWGKWLKNCQEDGDMQKEQAELLVKTINLTAGRPNMEELLPYSQYERLVYLTNEVSHQLCDYQKLKTYQAGNGSNAKKNEGMTTPEIESNMQELTQLVLYKSSDAIASSDVKHTFLTVAKSFYYAAYFDPATIDYHMSKVLFERVY